MDGEQQPRMVNFLNEFLVIPVRFELLAENERVLFTVVAD